MNHKILEYVKKEIAKIEADERYHHKGVDCSTNPSLALIQNGFVFRMSTLSEFKMEIEDIPEELKEESIKILFRSPRMDREVLEYKNVSIEEAMESYHQWWLDYGKDKQHALNSLKMVTS